MRKFPGALVDMRNKIVTIICVFLFLVLAWFFLRFVVGGPEDDWICTAEGWVRHGNPSAPMPTKICGKTSLPANASIALQAGEANKYASKIRVEVPELDAVVKSPLEFKGEARGSWFFEASFPVKITDKNGNVLGQTTAQAKSDWMTEDFVPFEGTIEFAPTADEGYIVFLKDNPSGLPENADEYKIPVKFEKVETTAVKVYFNNDKMDPEFSCNKVFPVEREVIKTQAVARAALEELLKGATEKDKSEGFFTSINPGVKIEKLTIENGIAKVDFNDQIEFRVGGSCRVSAIRAQITQTLKQFPTVKEVIISVNGRTEDILQP